MPKIVTQSWLSSCRNTLNAKVSLACRNASSEGDKGDSDVASSSSSTDLFYPLDIEGTFKRVYMIFTKHWAIFLITNAIAFSIIYVVTMFTSIWIVSNLLYNYDNSSYYYYQDGRQQDHSYVIITFVLPMTVELIVYYVVHCLADGANIHTATMVYLGKKPSMLNSFHASWSKLGSLLGSCLLVLFGLILLPVFIVGLLFALIFGDVYGFIEYQDNISGVIALLFLLVVSFWIYCIYISVYTFIMYPAIMIERQSSPIACVGAVKRSFDLTSGNGHGWYVFCTLLLFVLCKTVINAIVSSLSRPTNAGTVAEGSIRYDTNLGGGGDGIISVAFGILFASLGSM